jgi:hypothetical protein
MRDGVRFRGDVFEIAARVIAKLGIGKYSSMHVRRNELQYHEVKIPAAQMIKNIGHMFNEKEPLYIATDELKGDFFDAMRNAGHKVYHWADFGMDKLPRRTVGLVEQVRLICEQTLPSRDV